ncbi:MAG: methyltransferase domain-containing protein [Gammaproteobacteria bacterium]|nr:methyltransferase domain-containing protein [Gammaproteobacteria bacterium]
MTSFKSTADLYSRYRVPYPKSLLTRLRADANLRRASVVLDLATGPGRIALALAPTVHEVIAVDAEPEMLEEGKRIARQRGITNVKWMHARAEELSILPGSMDLVTIGEALHRLDEELILPAIRQWLRIRGCVAIVGCFGVLHGEQPWQSALRQALSGWSGELPNTRPRGKDHDTRRLIDAGFDGVANREFIASCDWTRDSILGHLHSTSRFSLPALGDELEDFESAVLEALGPDETRLFPQEISCGYSIGWNGGKVSG